MVALCPTCHDAVHNGPLKVDDVTVYGWKSIARSKADVRDHIYVEPQPHDLSKLKLGEFTFTGLQGVSPFGIGSSRPLSFRIEDEDIMLLNLEITTTAAEEVLRIVDGHVRHHRRQAVTYERVPGHVLVTAPASAEFVPEWALSKVREQDPEFTADGRLPLLDLEVLEPGVVQIHRGLWVHLRRAVVLTRGQLLFVTPEFLLTMAGEDTTFAYTETYRWAGDTVRVRVAGRVIPVNLPGGS